MDAFRKKFALKWPEDVHVDASIGKDAGVYCPDSVNVAWNGENQPFGYQGVIDLLAELSRALEGGAA